MFKYKFNNERNCLDLGKTPDYKSISLFIEQTIEPLV